MRVTEKVLNAHPIVRAFSEDVVSDTTIVYRIAHAHTVTG